MTMTEGMHLAIFAFLALVTVVSAIKVASARSIVHASFWLFPVFAGVAGFYLFLGAQFLAAIQVLIYIGAILVLIAFAVTLTRDATDETKPQTNRFAIPVVLASMLMLAALVGGILTVPHGTTTDLQTVTLANGVPVTDVAAIGLVLFQQYLLPFEIASVLLLAAMIGALVLARKERQEATPDETESTDATPAIVRETAGVG